MFTKKNKYSHYNPIATFLKMDSFLFDFGGLYNFNVNSEDPLYDSANPLMLHPEAPTITDVLIENEFEPIPDDDGLAFLNPLNINFWLSSSDRNNSIL
ncbi:MAG TPA: hypothetical protein PLN79_11820, partial [bacterium]|nr:hypothetical protein [bacterium]